MRFLRNGYGFFALLLAFSMILTSFHVCFGVSVGADSVTEPLRSDGTNAPDSADEEAFLAEQNYHKYYVTRDLVGLFTAFSEDDIDLSRGVWQNKKGIYDDAVLRGGDYWEWDNGGLSYRMTLDEWKKDGTGVGVMLPQSFANYSNFYTEVFATVVGITDENGDRYVNSYSPEEKDANGNVIIPAVGAKYGYFKTGCSAFRFELISTLFFCSLDDKKDSASLVQRWYLYNAGYSGSYPPAEYSESFENNPSNFESGWRVTAPDGSPAPAQMRVGKKTAGGSVTYSYSYSGRNAVSLTIDSSRRETLLSHQGKEAAGRFSLFNALPATVYAIRVYTRALTEKEILQNSFVDKAVYYRLDLEKYNTLSTTEKEALHKAFEQIGFTEDKEFVASLYGYHVEKDISKLLPRILTFEECRPVQCEAGGYRLLFSVDQTLCDFLTSDGSDVSFGGLVASAETVLSNEALTLENEAARVIAVGGADGSQLYYETVTRGKKCFSIAITTNDPLHYTHSVRVRGYVTVTTADGRASTAYVDAFSEATPDGVGSIAEVTDYFVNSYDGDLIKVCEYINSAVLRRVLSSCGISVRKVPEQTLSLYVNALAGNDKNDGATSNTAYATVEAAFAAAKKYLAVPGKRWINIYLSKGTHTVSEALTLSGDEILASEYGLRIIGEGADTVLTSERKIDAISLGTDAETGAVYFRLPKDDSGNYPDIRALYGDGKLLTLAHKGDCEDFTKVLSYRVVDAAGNALTTVEKNDWQLVGGQAAAKYGVFTLPASLFDGDLDAYRGSEMHLGVIWTEQIMHIDHLERSGEAVDVYVPYGACPTVNASHSFRGRGVWLENAKHLLNYSADTYYYDKEEGLVYYKEGARAFGSYTYFSYAEEENIFVFENVSGVRVSDLTVTGLDSRYIQSGITASLGQASSLKLYNGTTGDTTSLGFMKAAAIYGKNVEDSCFERIHVKETLGAGIVLEGVVDGVTIDSSSFINLGEAAIRLGTGAHSISSYVQNTDVTNNYVRNIGTLYKTSVGIQLNTAADCRVIGNTVMNVPYSAFSIGWIWSTVPTTSKEIVKGGGYNTYNTEVAYNYVTDFMTCMGDGGAFYLLGGNVTRSARDKTTYNLLHHNYVVATEESGKHDGNGLETARNLMCYYHDNSSSNWLDTENVLINQIETKNRFFGAFHQSIEDCEAQNNRQTNNYFVGFDSILDLYRDYEYMLSVNTEYGITASDYIYSSVASLATNTTIPVGAVYGFQSKRSSENAKDTVAAIFAASGSSLYSETRESGLPWTAPAIARTSASERGTVDVAALLLVFSSYEIGDVTMDGKIDEMDVWAVKQHVIKSRPLSEDALVYSDVNGDGKTDARDAMRIEQYVKKGGAS